jgi:hypothetical protein
VIGSHYMTCKTCELFVRIFPPGFLGLKNGHFVSDLSNLRSKPFYTLAGITHQYDLSEAVRRLYRGVFFRKSGQKNYMGCKTRENVEAT